MARPRTRTAAAPPAPLDPAGADAQTRRRLSGPAFRTFLNIAEEWGLDEAQRLRVLGMPGRSTYYAWREKAARGAGFSLGLDALLRLSAVFGVYKALAILFPDRATAKKWLYAENAGPLFGGQRPLDLLANGTQEGILLLRRFLDGWRGGTGSPSAGGAFELSSLDEDDIVIV
ncbi:MbcA/ParS/Xre antitoxin family protein [Amphiplicatus metriothermophilus]|uniref:Uncharacterized protein n=1 Tax=Amphiplicatus metriothermophilus TaxID=1519374 RepID=A0A239PZK5_9PROT|nr:MbcA/ParS/Xre antitoxin family protein [Amphiplicatus metriothermophilus]MBB5518213.1 hypothetical protein [Amphiplicatus metriothermophilus]SNT75396.1 Protein of unknown function [Amphiplicatus metriothermophilus]